MTDSIEPYANGLSSRLVVTVPIDPTHFIGYTWVTFEHKYETDSLLDGGHVEFSCDSMNWNRVDDGGTGGVPFFIQELNPPQGHIQDTTWAFNGFSSDWITSGLEFRWFLAVFQSESNRDYQGCTWENLDTIHVRFNFDSDSIQTDKNGWMIRNITIGNHGVIGAVPDPSQNLLKVFPNPASDLISLQLYDNASNPSDIRIYDMMGSLVFSSVFWPALDVSGLASGNYIVAVHTEERPYRQLLMVE